MSTTLLRKDLPRAGMQLISSREGSYLVLLHGKFYVRHDYTGDRTMHVNYYSIIATKTNSMGWTPTLHELVDFGPYPLDDNGQGWYTARKGDMGKISVQIGYSAPAAYVDDFSIPCPKVRKGIETRWSSKGYWEKYLKTEGWVRA